MQAAADAAFDLPAFQACANQKYLESGLSKDWPKGMLERINAL